MSNFNEIIGVIKTASMEALEDSKPDKILIGTVRSISPLEVFVDQKFTISKNQIILSRNVTDYSLMCEVNHMTNSASCDRTHAHGYSGVKEYKVLNALKVGEIVIMKNILGGQKFLIIDRLGED